MTFLVNDPIKINSILTTTFLNRENLNQKLD
jgi:hypothetical protein